MGISAVHELDFSSEQSSEKEELFLRKVEFEYSHTLNVNQLHFLLTAAGVC